MTRRIGRIVLVAVAAAVSSAHVGSPDAWYEGAAGPYRVLVHVQAPPVVPGIAIVNVKAGEADIERVTAFINRFDATGGAPPPDVAQPVAESPGWYRTKLWVMTAGSNSVTVTVRGARGTGSVVVPLTAVAGRRLVFNAPLAALLGAVGIVLALGMFTIVGAAVRESVLPPGVEPDAARRRRARFAKARAAVVFVLAMTGTAAWWRAEDRDFQRELFRPLAVTSRVDTTGGADRFVLTITDSAWLHRNDAAWLRERGRAQLSELVEDHGKLVHLFLIAADGHSAFAHLHPVTSDTTTFEARLPPLPPGAYSVFADIVHASGFTQTLTSTVSISSPLQPTRGADPDDAWATEGSAALKRLGSATPVKSGAEADLRFVVSRADSLELYMGMAGHAVVVRDDAKVFIHLHPLGTISMAAQSRLMQSSGVHAMTASAPPSDTLYFPYAFPQPGRYTVWVQVKRAGKVLTGAFAVAVVP